MQHDVLPSVLEALSNVEPGEREPALAGLWVVPLVPRTRARAAEAVGLPSAASFRRLTWSELVPPQPGRVRAHNLSLEPVVVDAGTVLYGGMSTRAVSHSTVVQAGLAVSIAVEALGARWWDQGPVRRGGRLGAVGTALLLQAAHGEPAVGRSARTALWALPELDGSSDLLDDAHAPTQPIGWAIVAEHDILAAWLPRRPGTIDDGSHWTRHGPRLVGTAFAATIQGAITHGALHAYVVGVDDLGDDVVLVRKDLHLVDRVIATTATVSP
jgi:hypothetical protein